MVKLKQFRVKVYTAKGVPIHVATFDVKASGKSTAKRKAQIRVKRENPDKPKGYFYLDIYEIEDFMPHQSKSEVEKINAEAFARRANYGY